MIADNQLSVFPFVKLVGGGISRSLNAERERLRTVVWQQPHEGVIGSGEIE